MSGTAACGPRADNVHGRSPCRLLIYQLRAFCCHSYRPSDGLGRTGGVSLTRPVYYAFLYASAKETLFVAVAKLALPRSMCRTSLLWTSIKDYYNIFMKVFTILCR